MSSTGVAKESGKSATPVEDIYAELPDLDRSPLADRPRLHQALAESRAWPDGRLAPHEREALSDYLAGKELIQSRLAFKEAALEKLAQQGFDVCRAAALDAIRADAMGIYRFDAARALGLLLSRYTGAVYVRRIFSDQLTAGGEPLEQIRLALEQGLAVPITVSDMKTALLSAWAALGARLYVGEQVLDLRSPTLDADATLPRGQLVAPQLPPAFGKKARVDAYMAPAALDLFAPPFGLVFPALGIEDALL
jgi:hypothetical protein